MSGTLSFVTLFAVVAMAAASQPWLGKWVSNQDKPAENWDDFVRALGLPVEKFGGNPQTELTLNKEGDQYKSILNIPSHSYSSSWSFKIGEEGSHVEPKFNNTEIKYKFTEDGDKLLAEVKVPAKNKVINDVYEVQGEELVKTYKVDGISGKRYFKKQV